jgi:hypothetical protein
MWVKGHFFIREVSWDVPRIGLEPTHLTAPEPKSGVSTNFTTWAGERDRISEMGAKLQGIL